MATVKNLVPNPALKVNSSGWFSGSRVTGLSGFDRTTGYAGSSTSGDLITPQCVVTAGTVYVFSISVRTTSTKTVEWGIDWRTSSSYISSSTRVSMSVPANTTRRMVVVATAPVGATRALGVLQFPGSLTATMAMLTAGSTVYDYFDGDSAGAVWDGTDGNSTSTLTISGKPQRGAVTITGTVVSGKNVSRAARGLLQFGGVLSFARKQMVEASTGRIYIGGSTIGDVNVPQVIGYKPHWLGRLGLLRALPPPHYGQEVEQSYKETAGIQESLAGRATKDVLGYHREWKWTWRFLRDDEALPLLALRTSPPRAPIRLIDSYSGGNLCSADGASGGSVSRSVERFTATAGQFAHRLMPSLPDELLWKLDGGIEWSLPGSTPGTLYVDDGPRWRVPVIPGERVVGRLWVAASGETEVRAVLRPYDVTGAALTEVAGVATQAPAPRADGLAWRAIRVVLDPPADAVSVVVGLRVSAPAGDRTVYASGFNVVHATAARLWSPGGGAPEVIVTEMEHTLPSPREHHMTLSLREV
jgi:hypothetical protein